MTIRNIVRELPCVREFGNRELEPFNYGVSLRALLYLPLASLHFSPAVRSVSCLRPGPKPIPN
jgi:hypothetical protein